MLDINVMSEKDENAINWLLSFSENDQSLKESIIIFIEYYNKCLKLLREKVLTDEELNETSKYVSNALTFLKRPHFADMCSTSCEKPNSLPVFSDEQIERLKEIPTKISVDEKIKYAMQLCNCTEKEILIKLCKVNRFYNMQLKYGHTARITHVANEEIKSLNIQDPLVKKTILTSALMHDIGRFYQAAHYNTLDDSVIKKQESKINASISETENIDLEVDHAIAGYYYSLNDLYALNSLGIKECTDLITHTIASVIVRFHQCPNSKMKHFEHSTDSLELKDEKYNEILAFLIDNYKNSSLLSRQKSKYDYDSEHILFIDKILHEIISTKRKIIINDLLKASSFFTQDEKEMESIFEKINNIFDKREEEKELIEQEIIKYLQSAQQTPESQLLDIIVEKIKNEINKAAGIEVIKSNEIIDIIKNLANYDIASSIEKSFKNNTQIPMDVKNIISASLNITMDADKIDILNQRAIGIYNTPYNPESYSIYVPKNMSFCDILNTYYYFSLNKENLVIDKNIIKIISNSVKNSKINLTELYGVNLEELAQNEYITVEKNSPLYKILVEEPWQNILRVPHKEKKDYEKVSDYPIIDVPTHIILNNIKEFSEEKQMAVLENLIIVPEQIEMFKTDEVFNRDTRKIQTEYNGINQEHIKWNPIVALIWQLNQFIFVNMRSKESFNFIKQSNMLENIYIQYQENPLLQRIIKKYLAYTLLFIDVITSEKIKEIDPKISTNIIIYDAEILTKVRNYVNKYSLENPMALAEYEEKIENFAKNQSMDVQSHTK